MLILSQEAWSAGDPARLGQIAGAAVIEARRRGDGGESGDGWMLLLLPHSGVVWPETEAFEALAATAKRHAIHLAGSLAVEPAAGGAVATVGFVFAPDGALSLRTGKITPDLIEGFGDTQALPAAEADFPVAKLPFAQVGMLLGEDVLFSHYARALVFNGAEVILNPTTEAADPLTPARRMSRWGRATDSAGYVASASPRTVEIDGIALKVPTSTALYNWEREVVSAIGDESFVFVELDIEMMRRKRATPQGSMPAIVRADVYARGYRKWAAEAGELPRPDSRAGWLAEARRRMDAEAARVGPKREKYEEQYDICVIQSVPRLIPLGVNNSREIIMRNLAESLGLAESRANIPSVRLVVFPEFWLTGPGGIGGIQRTVQDMEKLAISHGDEVFDEIGAFAKRNKVYVAFQNFEVHEKLPGRVFNSAFLIDDAGELVHTYRKNQCADVWGFLPDTTPGSIIDEFVDLFGYESLFPVADTPIGKIANMICFDNMSPEVAFALRHFGTEVICHSSSEPHGAEGRSPWDNARRLRAFENTAYMISAIDGGEHVAEDSDLLTFFRRGHTRVINYDGTVQGVVDGPGPVVLRAHVDLTGLRRARANPRVNFKLWSDFAAYAGAYSGEIGFPSNLWKSEPYVNPYLGAKELRRVIAEYMERGIYVEPASEIGADRYRTSDQV
ncbi:nitrilase-related carbon-nitrogen hydrolase [Novosphingobium kaempferiae]|uniref:nitrilase-related carbon-nitrogen hydrolase n=1 Tax=Novosphingobium kaempferiae TaxID=2896849 RepID=UPI001E47A9B3|nr:nitrilase-related carbon-nitrogen hydrolase [Novosphingobium kaempferiae]